jgi:N-acetylglucosaminyl-diphospho-decaprenol L-rhamnosyltransferase
VSPPCVLRCTTRTELADSVPTIAVAVPTFNSRHWIDACLRAVEAQEDVSTHVVVVDNGSTDGTPAHVEERWPEVRVLRLSRNVGYGEAVNRGVAGIAADYVLALNVDAELAPDCLRKLVAAVVDDPDAVVAAPLLLESDGRRQPSAHRFPTLTQLLGEALFLDRLPLIAGTFDYHCRSYRYDRRARVDWATGAVLLIEREAFDAVGGFDPAYFFFVEEVDLQRRLGERGGGTVIEPAARAVHHGGKAPVPAERFLASHDGWERMLAPAGGVRAIAVRVVLSLIALSRAAAWTALGLARRERAGEARAWRSMFLRTAAGSLRRAARLVTGG